jgi:hypothetical protein
MYRQLTADYFHHLQWREKLFGGFLVLGGALALAFYHTHKKDQQGELWFQFGWLIPLVGVVLSVIFFFLDLRCQEVLRDRCRVGQAFEERALRIGLFGSVHRVGREARRVTHNRVLQVLYCVSAAFFFVVFTLDLYRLAGHRVSALWQCLVANMAR